ncbi:MAG TPA: nuclear transport factor 2 family protein [Candidatus Acidoferrales bacterium]|nr:nuclear transport factor 2 family protein [Candidatus Acidoferrales bacterium]
MKKACFVSLLALLIALFPLSPALTADNDVRRDVLAVVRQFQNAGVRGDAAVLEQIFDANVTHFHPGSPYRFVGKDRLVREFVSAAASHQDTHFEMIDPQVQMADQNVAVVTYYIDESWMQKNGTRISAEEKATEVYVNHSGRWLMIHGHYSIE